MSQPEFFQMIVDEAIKAKNYLYIQSMDIESDMEKEDSDMEKEKIECWNANHKFEPVSIPTSGSESTSPRNSMPFTKEGPDLLLMALEGDDQCRFNSTTLKELSKKLQDDSINKIGLYGEQGSGKTTLVEAVRDKVKSLKSIFDAVLFATIPQNPDDDWKIQGQIANSLNLTFVSESQHQRAIEINSSLANKKRILVIFDDVPAKFDPEMYMGIPCSDQRCKFLLTTRYNQNCTLKLGRSEIPCQKMIPLDPLSPDDAERLLRKHSGVKVDKSDRSTLAKKIASECEWLPRTIIEIGSSLRGKSPKEWQGLLESLTYPARYQIFLSFRGKDTREHFTSSLYDELNRKGFNVFMDDNKLEDGDEIPTELPKAIEDSRLSIIVLSENYANSRWCLDELVHILGCEKTTKQLVRPIFYKVEPSDIKKHQTRDGINVMAELEKKFQHEPDKIEKWKEALARVSKIRGMTYKHGTQVDFIRQYVEAVIVKLKNYLYVRNVEMS